MTAAGGLARPGMWALRADACSEQREQPRLPQPGRADMQCSAADEST